LLLQLLPLLVLVTLRPSDDDFTCNRIVTNDEDGSTLLILQGKKGSLYKYIHTDMCPLISYKQTERPPQVWCGDQASDMYFEGIGCILECTHYN
jgi:hypothetical protein